ncbi:hypothetical protein SLEP1_g24856 [Rubroshorea leprosula]|uniref:Uncharacterized protein n=1 Tax=Rubroshorea leprosula TaxID=152421 RepID=A0AAV5JH72_9ROSI|nr:hypothetical protein SLEP1_g24856 [Rubroshorea leprosula]
MGKHYLPLWLARDWRRRSLQRRGRKKEEKTEENHRCIVEGEGTSAERLKAVRLWFFSRFHFLLVTME